ncbi:MAG TPA: PIN domain-containing protein [Candidatus Limnocylindria bacterium]|nr:PIN domain-containing protein [Candidatus Limnocylindria bacterium]
MHTIYIDTNFVVSFLLKRSPEQHRRAEELVKKAAAGELELMLSPVVVAEVAAILHHTYELSQSEAARLIIVLATARGVAVEEEAIVLDALAKSRDLKDVDFVDAYVVLTADDRQRKVATFDKALSRKLGVAAFDF